MPISDDIKTFVKTIPAELKEKKGVYELSLIVAERKTFLTRQKLEYRAKFRVDDGERFIKFTEILKESGSGVSVGDTTPSFGFKKESYSIKGKERESTIEEQSLLFGKKYEYKFDYKSVREKIKELAQSAGFEFIYQITSIGL